MTARDKSRILSAYLARRTGRLITTSDADTLRRAELTLHWWAEGECGDGNDRYSWAIERNPETGTPFRCVYANTGETRRYRIPDRESGALRRVDEVCWRLGLDYYHQTDPRGCALYVAPVDAGMTDSNYSSVGAACCEVNA